MAKPRTPASPAKLQLVATRASVVPGSPAEPGKLPKEIADMLQAGMRQDSVTREFSLGTRTFPQTESEFHVIGTRGSKACIVLLYVGGDHLGDPNYYKELTTALDSFDSDEMPKPYILILGNVPPHFQCIVEKTKWVSKGRVQGAEFIWAPAFHPALLTRTTREEIEEINKGIRIMLKYILPAIGFAPAKDPSIPTSGGLNTVDPMANEPTKPSLVYDERPRRTRVFISYSHADRSDANKKDWVEAVKKFINVPKNNIWYDTDIKPGQYWHEEIINALASTKVAVLLVTQNFLRSNFITSDELPSILKAAKEEGLRVHWVLVEDCQHEDTDLSPFQSANDLKKPLDSLESSELNTALKKIGNGIMEALKE